MMGVIAFFAGLVLIGTVVDITLNILHLDDVFSESFVQKFQGFSFYSNTIKLFHCPEPGASGALDCINGIRSNISINTSNSYMEGVRMITGAKNQQFCIHPDSGFFPCPGFFLAMVIQTG